MKKEKVREKQVILSCSSAAHSSVSSSSQDMSSQSDAHAHSTTDNGDNLMHCESEYSFPGDHRFDSERGRTHEIYEDKETSCFR